MEILLITAGILAALLGLIWAGLRVQPRSLRIPPLAQSETSYMPLPQGLPVAVERFYRVVYGEQIPLVETAVISGRGRMRPFGVWLPARFIFVHKAGKDYRHYIEATIFGIPFLKVDEGYIEGVSFFESPMGGYADDPHTNQAANLALWAEAYWFPALWISDPRARWQAVDESSAVLSIPLENGADSFIVRFDAQSGLIDLMEAMRYKGPKDSRKVLWITHEERPAGKPAVSFATWLDDGKPWAAFIPEVVLLNLDVSQYMQGRGS